MSDKIIRGNQNTTKLINQLKNSSEQYPILTKEQERMMINKYRNDRDKLNYLLFMHNIRTVFNQAKFYMSRTDDYDSLVQNGMLGLAEAARRFDLDKDIKFCTYANIWVHKYLSMPYWTAQFKLDQKTVSMNSPSLAADVDSQVTAEDTLENCMQNMMEPTFQSPSEHSLENEISAGERSRICDGLYRLMDADTSLSATDKAVFQELFVKQEKTSYVADKYKLTNSAVSEIKRRVLGKMKGWLGQKYQVNSYADLA